MRPVLFKFYIYISIFYIYYYSLIYIFNIFSLNFLLVCYVHLSILFVILFLILLLRGNSF